MEAVGVAWEWLDARPWFGSALGSSVGLVALLIAAWINAVLNRRRDDRLRAKEAEAIGASLGTELRGFSNTLADRFGYLRIIAHRDEPLPPVARLERRIRIPDPLVFASVAGDLGKLSPKDAAAVVNAWQFVALARNLLEVALEDCRHGHVDRALMEERAGYGLDAAAACARAADQLLGPRLLAPLRLLGREEARTLLSGRTGGDWDRYLAEEEARRPASPHALSQQPNRWLFRHLNRRGRSAETTEAEP